MSVRAFDSFVNSNIGFLNQPTMGMILGTTIALYAGLAAPKLPDSLLRLFDNGLFRLFFLFLIMYASSNQPSLALISAVAYVMILNALSGRRLLELFSGHIEHSKAESAVDEDVYSEDMMGVPAPSPIDMEM